MSVLSLVLTAVKFDIVELGKMEEVAEKKIEEGDKKEGEKLKKEINLAKNLKKMRKKKGHKKEKKSSDWW